MFDPKIIHIKQFIKENQKLVIYALLLYFLLFLVLPAHASTLISKPYDITASSSNTSTSFSVSKLSDGSLTTYWSANQNDTTPLDEWVKITLTQSTYLTKIDFQNTDGENKYGWGQANLYGSNDDINYELIEALNYTTKGQRSVNINKSYKYIKFTEFQYEPITGFIRPTMAEITLYEGVPVDTTAPSAPTSFISSNTTETSTTLTWTNPIDTDFKEVVLKQGETEIYRGYGTSFTATGLTANSSYNFSIVSVDNAGNISASSTCSVTTLGGTSTPPPPSSGVDTTLIVANAPPAPTLNNNYPYYVTLYNHYDKNYYAILFNRPPTYGATVNSDGTAYRSLSFIYSSINSTSIDRNSVYKYDNLQNKWIFYGRLQTDHEQYFSYTWADMIDNGREDVQWHNENDKIEAIPIPTSRLRYFTFNKLDEPGYTSIADTNFSLALTSVSPRASEIEALKSSIGTDFQYYMFYRNSIGTLFLISKNEIYSQNNHVYNTNGTPGTDYKLYVYKNNAGTLGGTVDDPQLLEGFYDVSGAMIDITSLESSLLTRVFVEGHYYATSQNSILYANNDIYKYDSSGNKTDEIVFYANSQTTYGPDDPNFVAETGGGFIDSFIGYFTGRSGYNVFKSSFNKIKEIDTTKGIPPSIKINLNAMFGAALSHINPSVAQQTPFTEDEITLIDFGVLNNFELAGIPLIDYFRNVIGFGIIYATFLYCYRKIIPKEAVQ